jgi:hypothetical protein
MKKQIGVKGSFHTQIINSDGSVAFDAGEQDNLIVDGGLDNRCFPPKSTYSNNPHGYLCLGSGVVTAPSVTDTDLGNQVIEKIIMFSIDSSSRSYNSERDSYIGRIKGTVDITNYVGSISEIGLKQFVRNVGAGVLLTRSLIKDANGNPTEITVEEGQTLRLTYYLYYEVPHDLGSGTISTPHGNLEWELRIGGSGTRESKINQALSGIGDNWVSLSDYIAQGAKVSSSHSYSNGDHKMISTVKRVAQTSNKTISAGSLFWGGSTSDAPTHYGFYLTSSYTIPANHSITVVAEMTWGRME